MKLIHETQTYLMKITDAKIKRNKVKKKSKTPLWKKHIK